MSTVIKVENLSKSYRLGQISSGTLTEDVNRWLARLRGRPDPYLKIGQADQGDRRGEYMWALKDVSFEVQQGEVLGIIGRNGAGKSTLLKILSRVTAPTSGLVKVKGRIASLLEVGTGFHPELTGRENIYLNGAILGMRRDEIARKFDEIVDFAEIEKFIDTPVKRYSSGMYVRLAFAVAAHLEPEILLVDEVLAVGDAEFQKKCLGKMGAVAGEGRTVLFVSHNMGAIRDICQQCILVDKGYLIEKSSTNNVIGQYLDNFSQTGFSEPRRLGSDLLLKQFFTTQSDGQPVEFLNNRQPISVRVEYEVCQPLSNVLLGFDVFSSDGTHLFRSYDLSAYGLRERQTGEYQSICTFPANFFNTGTYYFHLLIAVHRTKWLTRNEIKLKADFKAPRDTDVDFPGLLNPTGQWQVITRDSE